jgi:hypothetical protein
MNESVLEYQKQRIEALEAENLRLKIAIIRKESSVKDYLKRLSALIKDEAFNKPIQYINYESKPTLA